MRKLRSTPALVVELTHNTGRYSRHDTGGDAEVAQDGLKRRSVEAIKALLDHDPLTRRRRLQLINDLGTPRTLYQLLDARDSRG